MSSDISVAATRAFIGSGVGAFKVRIHHGSWSVGVVDRLGHSEHRCGHDALASKYEIVPDLNTSSAQQSSTAFLPPLLDAVRPLSRDQRRAPVIHAKTPSSSWLRVLRPSTCLVQCVPGVGRIQRVPFRKVIVQSGRADGGW